MGTQVQDHGKPWSSIRRRSAVRSTSGIHLFHNGLSRALELTQVTIQAWEYPVAVIYMAVIMVFLFIRQRRMRRERPEYRFYAWGGLTRMVAAVAFTLIYVYYYKGGDTINYLRAGMAMANIAIQDPTEFFGALFASNTQENLVRYYSNSTGYPEGFVYFESRTYMLIRLIGPLVLLAFKSPLVTSVLLAAATYSGIWGLYRMLVDYYPRIKGRLAMAMLFFPTVAFWGSGIMKDTVSFAALCWFIVSVDRLFIKRTWRFMHMAQLVVSSLLILSTKPYIFMGIFPACLLWVLYQHMAGVRNAAIRNSLLPVAMALLLVVTLMALERMGDRLGKFSLDNMIATIITTQKDLSSAERYGTNYFDVGTIEPTWTGVLSKFPQATFAALFRPSLLDVANPMMLLAALENTMLLGLVLYVLWRTRVVFFITLLQKNPLLQMCMFFTLGYGFLVALSTPNFGAMVRFKVPFLPLFLSALFISVHIVDRWRESRGRGERFDFGRFANGDPEPLPKPGRMARD